MTAQRKRPTSRSAKAGRPPESPPAPPRVRRRQKSAEVRLRKGATLRQVEGTPEPLAGARAPERGGKPRRA